MLITFFFAVVQDLAIIGIHTDPDKAEAELNALVTVHDDIKSRWKMGMVKKLLN